MISYDEINGLEPLDLLLHALEIETSHKILTPGKKLLRSDV